MKKAIPPPTFIPPKVHEGYIHRIYRTGRACSEKEVISLVSADDVKLLPAIETLIRLNNNKYGELK